MNVSESQDLDVCSTQEIHPEKNRLEFAHVLAEQIEAFSKPSNTMVLRLSF